MKSLIAIIGLLGVLCGSPLVAAAECFVVEPVEHPGPNFKIFLAELDKLEERTCASNSDHRREYRRSYPDYAVGFEFLAPQGKFRVNVMSFSYFHGHWEGPGDALESCYTLGAFVLPKGNAARELAITLTKKLEEGRWQEEACAEYPGD